MQCSPVHRNQEDMPIEEDTISEFTGKRKFGSLVKYPNPKQTTALIIEESKKSAHPLSRSNCCERQDGSFKLLSLQKELKLLVNKKSYRVADANNRCFQSPQYNALLLQYHHSESEAELSVSSGSVTSDLNGKIKDTTKLKRRRHLERVHEISLYMARLKLSVPLPGMDQVKEMMILFLPTHVPKESKSMF
jgi:hypothetical protein